MVAGERSVAPELRLLRRLWELAVRGWQWFLALRPAYVLGSLIVVQWLAVFAFAVTVRHNGWLYYQGGDQTYYYSSSWALAHGHLPQSPIGYGWSLLLAPVALAFGPSFLAALPAVVLLQTLLLLPLALLLVYGIASRIGGRALGYVAAVAWVVGPFIAIPGFVHRFHPTYVEQFLPQALGFTGLSDFFSLVLVSAAAYFFLRALDTRSPVDAAVAGVLTGFAIGTKPANAVFVLGPALAVLVGRRWRTALVYGSALLPGLVALALWKERGLGHIPLISSTGSVRLAAGAALGVAPPVAALPDYTHLHWSHLSDNLSQIQEFFWSQRLIEWLPIAGVVALGRISWTKAALVGGWLAGFVLVKGASPGANVEDGTFFRLLMPAWPAFVIAIAALPALVPGVAGGYRKLVPHVAPLRWRARPVLASFALLGAIPLLCMAAFPLDHTRSIVDDYDFNTLVPITSFGLHATAHGRQVVLTWHPPAESHSAVFYRVYRVPTSTQAPVGGLTREIDGIACVPKTSGASSCRVLMQLLPPTRATRFVDTLPYGGGWSYRIGLAANWVDDPTRGDILLLSEPARVAVR